MDGEEQLTGQPAELGAPQEEPWQIAKSLALRNPTRQGYEFTTSQNPAVSVAMSCLIDRRFAGDFATILVVVL